MGMLIGLICDVILSVGEAERELSTLSMVADKIEELILSHGDDESNDDFISKNEFKQMLANKKAVSILHEVGVDVVSLVDFADTIFEAGDGDGASGAHPGDGAQRKRHLTFGEFMGLILDLRGSNTARNKDIVNLQKHMNYKFQRLENRLMNMGCVTRYDRARHGSQEDSLSGETTGRRAQRSVWGVNTQETRTQTPGQSHLSFQDTVTGSLRDLRASHERELAVLRADHLRLLDKLAEHEKAAGKSLAGVLAVSGQAPEVAANFMEVPRFVDQFPIDAVTFSRSSSNGMDDAAAAKPQPATSPPHTPEFWRTNAFQHD